ncbi:MAG: [FeFe] hydrogenase, group A [Oscillospiraceae bacterium]|nr:[FeFe] hydrogenase, group A [Oscillospiraceae bacterium]
MVNLTIDGRRVSVPEGTTILEAARTAGIRIPTLCYLKDINQIGACRVCVVEVEGWDHLAASCNADCEEGMVVHTNTPRVRDTRRLNVEMILSRHHTNCTSCVRSGNCSLQSLARDMNVLDLPFPQTPVFRPWDHSYPLIRDMSKCINCMRCVAVCDKVQDMKVWDVTGTGTRTAVAIRDKMDLKDVGCTYCGQCITHCPVGALRTRDDTMKAFAALSDPEKICVVQVAPAVRAAWGEDFGLTTEEATLPRLVAVLKAMGFDYVFDTDFAADLTIMEESSEFVERMTHPTEYQWPMFTSCCPGWVRYVKIRHPELLDNLSTAKSPQQMFGAVTKSYFAEKIGVDPEKLFCISIMPCTAKKYECAVEEVNDAGAGQDVDLSITTRELVRMIKVCQIDPMTAGEAEFDDPLGESTGAGVIFGATGGVMEAALRSAYFLITGENPDPDAFSDVRGLDGWKERTFRAGDITVRTAVASGLANTSRLIDAIQRGEAHYDFVEIMACPSGCSGGGGQPIEDGVELGGVRGQHLYKLDQEMPLRFSHENPSVQTLYAEYLQAPLSHRAHELLHTDLKAWKL